MYRTVTSKSSEGLHMRYVFRRNSSVGAMDAESDERFLRDCFFDTGDLAALVDCENPKRIVVGRVGAGKSAAFSADL